MTSLVVMAISAEQAQATVEQPNLADQKDICEMDYYKVKRLMDKRIESLTEDWKNAPKRFDSAIFSSEDFLKILQKRKATIETIVEDLGRVVQSKVKLAKSKNIYDTLKVKCDCRFVELWQAEYLLSNYLNVIQVDPLIAHTKAIKEVEEYVQQGFDISVATGLGGSMQDERNYFRYCISKENKDEIDKQAFIYENTCSFLGRSVSEPVVKFLRIYKDFASEIEKAQAIQLSEESE